MIVQGGWPGGLVSQCQNVHSGARYAVSTVLQAADSCWTTLIFPCIEQRSWFGLVRHHLPEVSRVLRTYMRNSEAEAQHLHCLVEQLVTTVHENAWDSQGPNPIPPDGFTEAMQRKLEERSGEPPANGRRRGAFCVRPTLSVPMPRPEWPGTNHAGRNLRDTVMAARLLSCAIEQIADWHAHLFVEPHIVALVAVTNQYSRSPARFEVECRNSAAT
jgi:hypothetical protein